MSDEATITLALAIVMGIAWLVRIEGKVLSTERDLARIEADQDSKMNQILETSGICATALTAS